MARDRIFGYNDPTNYSPKELNRINWGTYQQCLNQIREASNKDVTPMERGFGTMIDPIYLTRRAQFDDAMMGGDQDGGDDQHESNPKLEAACDLLHSGADVDAVLDLLSPEDLQDLVSDDALLSSLPDEVRQAVEAHAGGGDKNNIGDESDEEDYSFPSSGTFGGHSGAMSAEASFNRALFQRLAEKEDEAKYEGACEGATDHRKDEAKYEGANEPATDHTKGQAKGRRHVDINMKRRENPVEKVNQPEVREASLLPQRDANGRVIFTDPIQLSTEACEAALAIGDIALFKTMTAARNKNRLSIANLIREMEDEDAPAPAKKVASKKAGKPTPKVTNKIMSENPTKMSQAKKDAFRAACAKHKFPEAYVNFMLESDNSRVAEAVKEINSVGESKLSKTAKTAAVSGLIKMAELDDENKRHCVDYWVNQLGYDRAWTEELFMKNYGKNS